MPIIEYRYNRRKYVMRGLGNIIKGISISLVCSFVFLFIFSLILTYTNVSETFIAPVVIVITAMSIFIGSSIGNFNMKKNGLLNGAIIGGIYLLGIYLLSAIINNNFNLNIQSVIIITSGIVCGMIGGIIGVNKG